MKGSIIILSFFALGVILGATDTIPEFLSKTDFSIYALYALMLLVGISIGADRKALNVIFSMNRKSTIVNFRIFLIPIGVILGTLIGSAIVSLILPEMELKETLAVGAGFGYYSLSSVLITEIHSESLGVIALLSNIMREVITLLFTPLLVKYFGKLSGIAAGGATSMDTTLPIITKYSGKEYVIVSIFSGIILTILVPFLVTSILGF
jgi:uncharacterized membrane protein YbjE (DUF340 family)